MGWILGFAVGILAVYAVWTDNRLVALRKRAEGAGSDIDVQLTRRWDLEPILVASSRLWSGAG